MKRCPGYGGAGDPRARFLGDSNSPRATFDLLLQPYAKSTQILTCPDDSFSTAANITGFDVIRPSYSWARYLFLPDGPAPAVGDYEHGAKIASIPSPSLTVLMGERFRWGWDNGSIDANAVFEHTDQCASSISRNDMVATPDGTDAVHLGTYNFLFADDHVKAIRSIKNRNQNPHLTGHTNAFTPTAGSFLRVIPDDLPK